ncbi:hypothetical protein CVS47_00489 [Microbacterium lemovicicum]|uniref:Uncharacterized protein n=1 Tax=Microbacterium lemovicicum TaxID=1072463 RepID=A0A3Q9IXN9_9MICO|nr:hypothetical protein [Microbacterium lemovicicum]AZS35891.1 hypothetical protein CVS47_00489 [Microbacterium lemovicicum]
MTDLVTRNPADAARGLSRRSVMKGAAWSVPVIVASAAAPMAVASVNNAGLAWTSSNTGLLTLGILDSASLVTAQTLVTVPTQLTITNGSGAISGESATVQITVGRPSGIPITVGRARGFGVRQFDGASTPSGSRTATYQSAPIVGQFGFPLTTYSTTVPVTIAANGSLNIPVQFGLAGNSTGLTIAALADFPVTTIVTIGGRTLTAATTISVPVGAGIL